MPARARDSGKGEAFQLLILNVLDDVELLKFDQTCRDMLEALGKRKFTAVEKILKLFPER